MSADWEQLVERNQEAYFYGVVHAAWLPPAGQSAGPWLDAIRAQVEFGTMTTIRIACFLRSQAAGAARRWSWEPSPPRNPVLNTSCVPLGKAALEHTARLLSPELARSDIVPINLVAPSFVPIGMNDSGRPAG